MVNAHTPDGRAAPKQATGVPGPQKLQSVQALRGLAAFLVLLYHTAAVQQSEVSPDNAAEMGYLTGFWDQGFAGVDMFFVISGFIMVYITRNYVRSVSGWLGFFYARITRIYPLWWVFAGIMAVYFLVVYGQPASPKIIQPGQVGPHLVQSFLLLPQKTFPVLSVGWTLVHEVFFYVIFGGLLLFGARWRPWFMAVWAGLVVAMAFAIGSPRESATFFELLISPLALEFLAGALIGYLVIKPVKIPAVPVTVISGLALALALFIGIDVMSPHLTWHRVLVYTLPCAGLMWGLVTLECSGRICLPKWTGAIGDASYSLYLSHIFVLRGLIMAWSGASTHLPESLQFTGPGMIDNVLFAIVGISASIIFSLIVYRLVEKPALNLARKFRPG